MTDSHFVWVDNNKLATYFDVTLFPYVLSVNENSSKWPLMWGAIECHCKRVFFNCLLANMLIIPRAKLPPLKEETGFHCIDEGVFARCITPASYLDGKGKIRQIVVPASASAVDITTPAVVSPSKRRKSLPLACKTTTSLVQSASSRRRSFPSTTNGDGDGTSYIIVAAAAAIDDETVMMQVNLRLLYSLESNLPRLSGVKHRTRVMARIARTGHHLIRHLIAMPMNKNKAAIWTMMMMMMMRRRF